MDDNRLRPDVAGGDVMDYLAGHPTKVYCPECHEQTYVLPKGRTEAGKAAFTCSICDSEWYYKPYLLSMSLAFDNLQLDPRHHRIFVVRGEEWSEATGFTEHPQDFSLQVEGQWVTLPNETMVMLVKAVTTANPILTALMDGGQ